MTSNHGSNSHQIILADRYKPDVAKYF